MQSEFSPEIHDSITTLCKRISVAHHLNEEIQKELHDHIIDKMESYLNGEETILENDAFLLVKEHFGNPEVIRSMYESIEPAAAYGSMLRRIEAATVATIFSCILGGYVFELIFSLLAKLTPNTPVTETFIFAIPKTLSQILGILLFGTALARWRGKINRGEQPWFFRIKQRWFAGLIFSAILLMIVIINSTFKLHLPYNLFTIWTLLAGIMIHCILWLMWIDGNSERMYSIFFGFLSCIIVQILIFELLFGAPILHSFRHGIWPGYFLWLVPSVLALLIYTLLIAIQRVKVRLIGSLA
jgi:hypothetical protein